MEIKRILFIGLGGAGQRHLRIFKKILPSETEFYAFRALAKTPLLNSDFTIDNNDTLERKYSLRSMPSLDEALDMKPDIAVISTPSSLHYETAMKAAQRNINLLIEKPFSHNLDGFDDFQNIILEKQFSLSANEIIDYTFDLIFHSLKA